MVGMMLLAILAAVLILFILAGIGYHIVDTWDRNERIARREISRKVDEAIAQKKRLTVETNRAAPR